MAQLIAHPVMHVACAVAFDNQECVVISGDAAGFLDGVQFSGPFDELTVASWFEVKENVANDLVREFFGFDWH